MPVVAGARLGPYQVLEPLGAGAMGEVYRAHDPRLGRDVAVKVLPVDCAESPDRLRRFEREARLAGSLSHPNVLSLFDVGFEDGFHYLVTELLEGLTLRHLLYKGPLGVRRAVEYARQIADGLAAAHAKGIVHRDLKPENLFVTRDGPVKILDFGLAKLSDQHPDTARDTTATTTEGRVLGTAGYMSPEQVRGQPADTRSDIFALGTVLYEMLSGRRAFSGDTAADTAAAILTKEPEELRRRDPGLAVPPGLERIVRRCLEKDPRQRFQTSHDLALALESVVRAPAATGSFEEAKERSPYPGLSSFTEHDSGVFFGRETEVRALWQRLKGRRLLAVIGPSGSGKTSFLRAGVIPARPEGWAAVYATPAASPALGLARGLTPELVGDAAAMSEMLAGIGELTEAGEAGRLVAAVRRWRAQHAEALIVVDQFEELFTLNAPEVSERFATLLGRIASEAEVHVVLSLRDDFLIRCSEHEPLAPVFESLTPLTGLTPEGLRRALVEPAKKSDCSFEDGLVEQMVATVEGVRGALPLLAFAVARLWEKRDSEKRLLTRTAYEEIGGVAGALGQHAEAAMERIGAERQVVVREIFRNLVTAQGTRAVIDREELLSAFAGQAAAEGILNQLIDARLLTSYELEGSDGHRSHHRVEVVHESLLKAWPRLVRWQAQDEEGALLRDQLRQAAHLWDEKGRTSDLVWTGTAWREFELWKERYPGTLTALEESFARAMRERAQRRRRLQRLWVASLIATLAGVAIAIGISRQQATGARDQARAEVLRAEASKLLALAQSRLAEDPTEALAFTTASLQLADTREARAFVMRTLSEAPPALELDIGIGTRMPAFSPDGQHVAVAGHSEDVRVFSQDGRGPIALPGHERSPRGPNVASWSGPKLLATGLGGGGRIATRVQLWSIPEGHRLRAIDLGAPSLWQVSRGQLLAETLSTTVPGKQSVTLRGWTLPDGEGRVLGTVDWTSLGASSSAFAPDDTAWLYSKGNDVYQVGLPITASQEGHLVHRFRSEVSLESLAEGRVLVRERSGEVRVWPIPEAAPGRARVQLRPQHATENLYLYPDPTDRWLLGFDWGTADSRLRLWETSNVSARPLELRRFGSWYGSSFDFHPQGRWVAASTRMYSRLTFWPLPNRRPLVLDGYASPFGRPVAFSPDSRWLATSWTQPDYLLRLWPLTGSVQAAPRQLRVPGSHGTLWRALSFDPRGRYVFAVGNEDQAWIIPLDGSAPQKLPAFSSDTLIDALAVSPSGRHVAWAFNYGSGPRTLRVWDTEMSRLRIFDLPARSPGAVAASPGTGFVDGVFSLRFSDEKTLYSSSNGGLRRWKVDTGSQEVVLATSPDVAMAMGPSSGVRFVLVTDAGPRDTCCRLRLYDFRAGTARPLSQFGCVVAGSALDSTGTIAAVPDDQGVIRVGGVDGGEPHLLMGHAGLLSALAISPDGRWVASSGEDNTLRLWPMPDLSKPPLHALPREQLLATLRTLTNLRAVRDASTATGWKIELGPFPGWKDVPTW